MRRNVYDKIVAWHKARKRKPLVLMGARQVGKTWLMEHFAAEYYPQDTVEINLMRDELLRDNFERVDLKPQTVVSLIELATGKRIVPGKTLLIIDEIQESMRALTSLKFFCEEMPDLAIMVAGSLLGVALRSGKKDRKSGSRPKGSFPVGKVDFLAVRPLTFGEFLDALGEEVKDSRTGEGLDRVEDAVGTVQVVRVTDKVSYVQAVEGDAAKMVPGSRLRRVSPVATGIPVQTLQPSNPPVKVTPAGGVVVPF